jgi:hypothetical protein
MRRSTRTLLAAASAALAAVLLIAGGSLAGPLTGLDQAKEPSDVRSPIPRPRRPGRRDGRRASRVRGVPRGPLRPGVPSFGSERMGAPDMSFCRIDDRAIRTREPVSEPDALVIQDATLLHQADLFAGLTPRGYVLVNSTASLHGLGLDELAAGRRPVHRRGGRGQRRRRPGGIRIRQQGDRGGRSGRARRAKRGADEGEVRCLSRSRVPARSPRRWPPAGRR